MLLCDIGNTSYHFLSEEKNYKENIETFNPQSLHKKVYFISVNAKISQQLKSLENWIDLSVYIDKSSYYETMGIDRIFAIQRVSNAVVLDAGSAITVDVVKNDEFLGGFIYPGIKSMTKTYANISPALDYSFNFDVDLDIMPKNSQDAITYGFVKTLYSEVMSHNLPVILTGGDASAFKKIFKDAKIDDMLIFNSMKKIITKAKLC